MTELLMGGVFLSFFLSLSMVCGGGEEEEGVSLLLA